MNICFSTFVYSDNYKKMSEHMIASCKKFHPNIPFEIHTREMVEKILKYNSKATLGAIVAYIGEELSYKYDLVIHIDADSIITGDLDELLLGNYDVASVRNNNEYNKAGMCNPGFTRINCLNNKFIGMQDYLNTGCHAVKSSSRSFWKDWQDTSIAYANTCLLDEQDTMNDVFYSGKYNTLVLDSPEKSYYYGVSNSWGEESHYESWKDIILIDNKIFLKNKQIKILHAASGESSEMKFKFDEFFKTDVSKWIQNLII